MIKNSKIIIGIIHGFHGINGIRIHNLIESKEFFRLAREGKIFFDDDTTFTSVKTFNHQSYIIANLPSDQKRKPLFQKKLLTYRENFGKDPIIMDFIGLKVVFKENQNETYGTIASLPNFGGGQLVEVSPKALKNGKQAPSELYLFNNFSNIDWQNNTIVLTKPKIVVAPESTLKVRKNKAKDLQ